MKIIKQIIEGEEINISDKAGDVQDLAHGPQDAPIAESEIKESIELSNKEVDDFSDFLTREGITFKILSLHKRNRRSELLSFDRTRIANQTGRKFHEERST